LNCSHSLFPSSYTKIQAFRNRQILEGILVLVSLEFLLACTHFASDIYRI
jgi:hypothetical protein